jgi:hypothetical protein
LLILPGTNNRCELLSNRCLEWVNGSTVPFRPNALSAGVSANTVMINTEELERTYTDSQMWIESVDLSDSGRQVVYLNVNRAEQELLQLFLNFTDISNCF